VNNLVASALDAQVNQKVICGDILVNIYRLVIIYYGQ